MKFKYTVDYEKRKVTAIRVTAFGAIYQGVAVCAPEDEFDIKKGRQIAELKARQKQMNKINIGLDKDTDSLYAQLIRINARKRKNYNQRIKIEQMLEELTNESINKDN